MFDPAKNYEQYKATLMTDTERMVEFQVKRNNALISRKDAADVVIGLTVVLVGVACIVFLAEGAVQSVAFVALGIVLAFWFRYILVFLKEKKNHTDAQDEFEGMAVSVMYESRSVVRAADLLKESLENELLNMAYDLEHGDSEVEWLKEPVIVPRPSPDDEQEEEIPCPQRPFPYVDADGLSVIGTLSLTTKNQPKTVVYLDNCGHNID